MPRRAKPISTPPEDPRNSPIVIKSYPTERCIPTGCTLLNLACTGNPFGGFLRGSMVNVIGDSSAGKTLLLLTMFAEIATDPRFKNTRLVHDEPEAANEFDIPGLFGKGLAKRLTGPAPDMAWCETLNDFYFRTYEIFTGEQPCVYGLDSMDALETDASLAKFVKNKGLSAKGEDGKGSYGTDKAKLNSENLRKLCRAVDGNDGLLFIVSQTRESIGFGFATRTRAGGRALKFYATHEIWLAVKGQIKRTVRGKDRVVGQQIIAKITKNKATGTYTTVEFPIMYHFGVDDTMANIDFLCDEKEWTKKKGGIIDTKGFASIETTRSKLANAIDKNPVKKKALQELVGVVWNDIQQGLANHGRLKRYI